MGKIASTNFGKQAAKFASNLKPYVQKATGWLKALPKPAKIVLATGAALTAIVSGAINARTNYDAGKIDQKYTDKAKLEKSTSEILD